MAEPKDKSLESWIWDAARSISGANDAPKYKDYILPLIFPKRLRGLIDGEVRRFCKEAGSLKKSLPRRRLIRNSFASIYLSAGRVQAKNLVGHLHGLQPKRRNRHSHPDLRNARSQETSFPSPAFCPSKTKDFRGLQKPRLHTGIRMWSRPVCSLSETDA